MRVNGKRVPKPITKRHLQTLFSAVLSDTINTAFATTSSPRVHAIWTAIEELPAREWNQILSRIGETMADYIAVELNATILRPPLTKDKD